MRLLAAVPRFAGFAERLERVVVRVRLVEDFFVATVIDR
jgi:hypothetical protein